ncbi:sensor histidine kinase [Paenibacillus glycanilyticus]|uniref:histidine kinase n=1 Tax=Paenibacillus glycanilyticus TaxID=126569 RepID=A0ABQ6G6I7_9BACL|nr:HAMP domain-containing sensor histidine kinase [Paenibacillus glycanilyticus]GLX66584.1 two-component sensor histidine kinase [Paenibacillus glycanilyticus]
MDTKWRSRIRLFIYSLLIIIGLSGPLTLLNSGDRYLQRDYYHTEQFRYQLEQFTAYLNLFELNSPSKKEALSSIKVDKSEIVEYRNELGSLTGQVNNIRSEYAAQIQDALNANSNSVATFYKTERDQKIKEMTTLYQDDDQVTALIMDKKEERLDTYFRLREAYRTKYNDYLTQFDYYFVNPSKDVIHTNLSVRNEQNAHNELISGHAFTTDYTVDTVNSLHKQIGAHELVDATLEPYQGWVAVPAYGVQQKAAKQYKLERSSLFAYVLVCTILLVVCIARFKRVMSRQTNVYYKLPIDARVVLMLGAFMLTGAILLHSAGYYSSLFELPLLYVGKLLVSIIAAALGMAFTLHQGKLLASELQSESGIRTALSRSMLKRSGSRVKAIIEQMTKLMKSSFLYKSTAMQLFFFSVLFIGLGYIGGWMITYIEIYDDYFYLLFVGIAAVIGIVVFLLFLRKLGFLSRIAIAADELAAGRTPDMLPRKGSGVVASLAININALRQGVSVMQNEQAKSERLKTELITNVSHDLRTPLTSIITYAGLLKSGDASREEQAAYAEIIDQKSKRLKTMIDDLFEVSTMASGNAKLQLEETDVVQLMQQALAEYKEVMDNSNIQFRISIPEEPVYVVADGQKLWRVFDNLIGNMMKYAMEHTRAYITIQASAQQEVAITFKNVSKYEINDHAEELFERFKRGDTSRHTDGSGLGLAIAKSIIDLHKGRLTLETDGDLFKATVILAQQ